VIGQAAIEQGTVGIWNAFIEMDNRVYSFLGYAPAQMFNQMRPTFEGVTGGFSPLRDTYAVNVQPARLRLVRAEQNVPFASFVPTSLPNEITADRLAVMNQLDLNQPVRAGRLLKIPDASGAFTPAWGAQPAQPGPYPGQPPQGYPQNYPPPSYPAQQYPQPPPQGYPYPQNPPPNWPR
jgi:hypothetical protein